MQGVVQLTKQEKLKSLNQRLSQMLAKKKEIAKQIKIEQPDKEVEQEKKQEPKQANPNEQLEKKTKRIRKKLIPLKNKKNLRKAAGYVWEDPTLQQWNENDYRIFCGNLGNEVNDEVLGTVFRRYASFQKGKVVRDRRTGKSRGYGFISFSNPKDFLACLEEMNGKYVGMRPVRLKKSNWKDRNIDSDKHNELPLDFKKNAKKKTLSVNANFRFTGKL